MGIFGDGSSSTNSKEAIRTNKRMIDRAIRELDRERTRIEREETKHVAELKKAAQGGHKVNFPILFLRQHLPISLGFLHDHCQEYHSLS